MENKNEEQEVREQQKFVPTAPAVQGYLALVEVRPIIDRGRPSFKGFKFTAGRVKNDSRLWRDAAILGRKTRNQKKLPESAKIKQRRQTALKLCERGGKERESSPEIV